MEGTGQVNPSGAEITQYLFAQYQKRARRSCRKQDGGNYLWNMSRAALAALYPAQELNGCKAARLEMLTTRLLEAQVVSLVTASLPCSSCVLANVASGSLLRATRL